MTPRVGEKVGWGGVRGGGGGGGGGGTLYSLFVVSWYVPYGGLILKKGGKFYISHQINKKNGGGVSKFYIFTQNYEK